MKCTICIGSSCHLKGSRQIVERLTKLVNDNGLSDQVELAGKFCMGNCANGVCVSIDDENFEHIGPDNVDSFFENEVMSRLH